MATKTIYVDDIDAFADAETIEFSYQGKNYPIDLPEEPGRVEQSTRSLHRGRAQDHARL